MRSQNMPRSLSAGKVAQYRFHSSSSSARANSNFALEAQFLLQTVFITQLLGRSPYLRSVRKQNREGRQAGEIEVLQ
jgi:hypothetical protein